MPIKGRDGGDHVDVRRERRASTATIVNGTNRAPTFQQLGYARIIGVNERVDDEPCPTEHDEQRRRENDIPNPLREVNE